MTFPTFFDLQEIFLNEDACIKYLINNELLYNQPRYGKCRKKTYIYKSKWKCSNKTCNWSTSIYKDTIFSNSNLNITGFSSVTIINFID